MGATQDLCYYKLLHLLGKFFAIVPNFNIASLDRCRTNHCYALFIALALCGMYAFGTYGKYEYLRGELAPSVYVTEIASDVAIIATNVVTILRINIAKGRVVCRMLDTLMRIDRELREIDAASVTYPLCTFVLETAFIVVFFGGSVVYNIYIWMITVGWRIFRFFAMRDVQIFQVLVAALLLSGYAAAIRNRVAILNGILVKANPNRDLETLFLPKGKVKDEGVLSSPEKCTRRLRKVYVMLMQALDDYNNIFGCVHLILYVNIVTTLLNPINLMLVYGIGDKPFPGGKFNEKHVMLCILQAALPVLIATWIFSACDVCIAEIKRIPNICNCLVQELEEDNEEAVVQLEKLAQQSANSCPEFSAAGFYTVNYNIYFSLMGSITTYLIVLIQFR